MSKRIGKTDDWTQFLDNIASARCKNQKIDILFLVDGSGGVEDIDWFKKVKPFLARLFVRDTHCLCNENIRALIIFERKKVIETLEKIF